jgi:4-hydroxy-tetrahydrodipicolinate synthase
VNRRLAGVVAPLAVPLTDDESVDEPALRGLIRYLAPHLDGYLLRGSSGEYAALRPDVSDRLLEVALEEVSDTAIVVVGVGDTSTTRAIGNIRRLRSGRIDAVAVTSTFYYAAPDQDALIRHFREVADASNYPVVLYNIPQNTGGNLLPTSVEKLAAHPNIVGIKDSWGDMVQFENTLFSCLPDGFAVMQGREELTMMCRVLGGAGIVSGLANLTPRLLRAVIDAVDIDDTAGAVAAQRDVNRAAAVFAQGHWLPALKFAIAELGFGTGRASHPLPDPTPAQKDAIRRILAREATAPEETQEDRR